MVASRITWPVLPALALLSCAGLLGLLAFILWSAVQAARSRTDLQARREADYAAVAVRAVLRHRDLVAQLPETARFRLARGEVVIPPSVGSLEPPGSPRRSDLDVVLRDKLDRLAKLPPATATAQLDALLGHAATPREHREWLLGWAAWWAHRRGDAATRDDYLRRLDAVQGGAAVPATLLLHAVIDHQVPGWAAERLALLPTTESAPLLRRLAEHGVAVAALAERVAVVGAQRATLRRVGSLLPRLQGASGTVLQAVGDGALLVFHAAAEGGGAEVAGGEGALLNRAQVGATLARVAALAEPPFANLPPDVAAYLAPPDRREAIDVVPGFLAVGPRPAVDPGWFSGRFGAALLVLALAALTGICMALFFRSVRREAAAARVRAEFLTMVTHELKTPLAGIRLLAEMLKDGHVLHRDRQQDYYQRLTSESVRLSMLIENVLDLGRMERGERAYDRQEFDLGELVGEAVELFAPLAERAGLRVRVDGPGAGSGSETGATVHADRHAILQCLLNVFDNARKYAAAGGRLEVRVIADPSRCAVAVRDHGPGIAAAERTTVFERFERGARHRDGSTPGVGLGLYLARSIARGHGGELDARPPDDDGAGVVFWLELPGQPLRDDGAAAESPREQSA